MKTAFTLATALFAAATVSTAQAEQKWNLATAFPDGNALTKLAYAFAEGVEAATDGEIKITVHSSGSLFPLAQIKRAVQTGDVEIGETPFQLMENEAAIFGLDNVPFAVVGVESAKKLWAATRPMIEERLMAQGIRVLYAVPWPAQGLYAIKPIESGADLAGLKFRSHGPSTARFGEMLNVPVTTVLGAELGEALATGRVEAMLTSAQTGVDTRIWETPVKYFYDLQAWVPKEALLMNEEVFQGLSEPLQAAILETASAMEAKGWEDISTIQENAKATLAANGMIVSDPSPKLVDDLTAIGRAIIEDWKGRATEDEKALYTPFEN